MSLSHGDTSYLFASTIIPRTATRNHTTNPTTKMVAAMSTIGTPLIIHARDMATVHSVLNHALLIALERAGGADEVWTGLNGRDAHMLTPVGLYSEVLSRHPHPHHPSC